MNARYKRQRIRCQSLLLLLACLSLLPVQAAIPDSVNGEPLPSLAPILEKVTPAVVNISTLGQVRQGNPLFDDPFFRQFFDLPAPDTEPQPQSLGSGVIVDAKNGYVITNSHVIENASKILVTLSDGRELDATLVGTDPKADIAVIKIEAQNLVALKWADSSKLRVGDFSVAIGNPFGLGQTVTSGIVSALGRSGLGIEDFEDFIQTDASINPGNSGGALINLRGELIGINTAIVGPSGGNVGIGFAIPSNMASSLLNQLVEFGEVRRGALGIAAQPLTAKLAKAFNVSPPFGVVIGRVQKNSPAEKGGLKVGDVITAIDGRRIRDVRAVRNRIGLVRLGQDMRLDVVRDGKPITIDVTIAELQNANRLLAGAELLNQRSRNGRRFVLVESVASGSSMEKAGIQDDDIILSVNQQGVGTVEELTRIASELEDELLLLIQRGRSTSYVEVK